MGLANLRVTKEFSFEMAHALYGYDGPCRNIHGHTYHLSVTILGPVQSAPGESIDGMVLDFSDLKKIVHQQIISIYDHALLLNRRTSANLAADLQIQYEKVMLLDEQPTCENILLRIVATLQRTIPSHLKLVKVTLRETASSLAEWLEGDS